jgi:CopG family nickel-responsive transcriptional regulator
MDEPADRISLTAPSELIGELDALVDDLGYASRSEAIRDALRAYITDCRWRTDTETTKQGSIVVLYNHESGVNDEILSLHHKMPDIVTSVQHVHLSRHRCLETLIVESSGKRISALADQLRSLEGVQQVRLAIVG